MADLIYIVEDDEGIRELIRVALQSYDYRAEAFETAEEGLAALEQETPALMIFDLMLPGIDGVEAVRRLRNDSRFASLPVIMLTAKDSELDKVTGLDAGADDYLTKPFGILELTARIRSLLRRAGRGNEVSAAPITIGGLSIHPESREVFCDGESVTLTYKEFELLRLLMEHPDRVVTREELLNNVWGYDFIGETRTLDMHVRTLRQKLGDDAEHPRFIVTVRGVGYRFKRG